MIVYLLSVAVLLLILEPLFTYYWDSKKLRRFPNASLLSGISDVGYILRRYRGFRSKEIHESHLQHQVVRVGPNSLSFSTPDAIRAIYGHNTPCLKGGTYVTAAGTHPSLLDVVDKQEHARKRRILSHAFATRNLEQWEFKVTDKVQKLVAQFDLLCHDGEEATVDFRMWSNLFTIEAIADIALSHHLGCLSQGSDLVTITTKDGEKAVNYIDCLHSGRRATSMLIWSTKWFSSLRSVLRRLPGFFQTQWHKGQGFDEMVRYLVQQRLRRHENGEQLEDFVGCLFQDKHGDARNLDIAEIEAEVATLLDAGSDTTAISLTHAMYFLMKSPAALSRLREELRVALDDSQEIAKYATVKNLPYLHACINESLRLLPPVAFGLNRMTPPEGLMIDGTWIPGNTLVGVPAYTAHRSPLFSNSEQYRPERWLEDSIKETQGTFIPFSTGARGCIGRNISYIEQTVLLATLVQRYDLSLVDPEGNLYHEEAFNLWPGPLPLKIRRRENC
ncbi:Benzoate 4-monooxygenase [Trichoderma lentiforme]|uniref:Benzoate 4-monooxygenase n=1 Tax=Trichoderma lentiforme TaxID=1567552 RepID=A0A9P4XG29_9HYPO|nr:Benzoate 4-monooxygenase [Trichoderma lentiforme]